MSVCGTPRCGSGHPRPGRYHRRNPVSNSGEDTLRLFQSTGAYLRGHFRLTSGLHSPEYLQCALVLSHPDHAESLGRNLAWEIRRMDPSKVELVVAPAMGGLIIGHEVARALNARFLFTERGPDGKMTLRRGFEVKRGETAVVIEDVITTGGSLLEVIDQLKAAGVNVKGAGSIIDRSGGRVNLGVPRAALATLHVISYSEAECPLCKKGLPVQKPGSRAV